MKTAWLLLGCTLLALSAATASAQPKPMEGKRYVEFAIDKDYEKTLKERLKMDAQLGPFKDLIKQVLADPSKMPKNPEQIKGLNLESDEFKEALKKWAASDPLLRKALEDLAEKKAKDGQAKDVEKFQEQLKDFLKENPATPDAANPPDPEMPSPVVDDTGPESLEERTKRFMEKTEESRWGDLLRDSPAWRRAFADLRNSINNPSASRWNLDDWQRRLGLQDSKIGKLGEGALDRLRTLPRPSLKGWGLPMPKLPRVGGPNVNAPGLPTFTGPSLPGMGTAALWIALAVLLVLVGWQMMRWSSKAATSLDPGASMGPWPVPPQAVATRAELVQAFDYLALLSLGLGVRSWNHVAIARQWREKAPTLAEPAQTLATLYEQARYTDGTDSLSDAERAQARRALVQLAEAL